MAVTPIPITAVADTVTDTADTVVIIKILLMVAIKYRTFIHFFFIMHSVYIWTTNVIYLLKHQKYYYQLAVYFVLAERQMWEREVIEQKNNNNNKEIKIRIVYFKVSKEWCRLRRKKNKEKAENEKQKL